MRVPISPHHCQHFLSIFFIIAILVGVRWHVIVVWIYIYLMTIDTEHLCMCLLTIYISLRKCLFRYFVHFSIGLLIFLLLIYKSSSYILEISKSPYQEYDLQIISYVFVGFFFHIFYSNLWSTKIYSFDIVQLICFLFCCLRFGIIFEKTIAKSMRIYSYVFF